MAVNKRKVLDAARKYAQKGAKEKALKEYHTLLKLDPRDAKLHLEIGDCYRRWGQIDEAVTQYARVAEQYKGDGFDARAVAVFKQILNLDPKRYSAFVSLADLYQRMGLDAEALAALQAAADGYHKEGQKHEALDLLRKMATLDPTNTTSRLKVADLLRQEGLEEDAIAEYDAVASELTKQGATESCLAVQEKILELQPDRGDVLISIARGLLELKKPERAEPFARRAVALDPEDSDPHELLLEVYGALGNETELAATTRQLVQVYRARGDDDKARDLTQRLPEAFQLDVDEEPEAESPSAIDQTESAFLSDDELLDEDFLATDESEVEELPSSDDATSGYEPDELETDEESEELLLGDDDSEDVPAVAEVDPPRPAPQGDPEQLFAEASVYLRYGKRDQAIASLAAVLEQEPEHRGALEKLGDAHAEVDESDQAVVYWSRAARIAQADQDEEGFEVLRDRIAAIDASAAAELARIEPFEVDAEGGAESELDSEIGESDLDMEVSSAEVTQPEVEDDLPPSLDFEDDGIDLDLELDVAVDEDEAESEVEQVEGEVPEEETSDADEDSELSFDVDDLDGEEESSAEDDTEDDAEDDADDSDQVWDAAEELSAAFEEEPEEEAASEAAAEAEFDADVEIDIDLDVEDQDDVEVEGGVEEDVEEFEEEPEPDTDSDTDSDDAPEAEIAADAEAPADVSEDLEEAEFYYQQELFDEAEAIYRRVLKAVPDHPSALTRLGELAAAKGDDADRTEVDDVSEPLEEPEVVVQLDAPPAERPRLEDLDASPDETTVEFPAPDFGKFEVESGESLEASLEADVESPAEPLAAASAESVDEGGMFDLAAELREVIEETSAGDADVASGLGGPSTVDDGFASIFSDFKQGVSATLSEDDYETRYDLGIAYREMELYADAIGEFQHCLESPTRKVSSLHMMGLCALDLGEAGNAANHLQQALAGDELSEDHRAGLLFDLGRALEASGDSERARAAYESTLEADPDFPEAAARLAGVANAVGDETPELAAESEDAGFESFDDLVSNANDGMADDEGESEHFESFDDVITGVDADLSEAEVVETDEPMEPEIQLMEPAPEPQAEPEPDPEPASEKPKPKRRKKISFV